MSTIAPSSAVAGGPHWLWLGGAAIRNGVKIDVTLKQVNPLVITFESAAGEPKYEIRCAKFTAKGEIVENEPGTDKLEDLTFSEPEKECSANSEAERTNKETNCKVTAFEPESSSFESLLSAAGGKLFDVWTRAAPGIELEISIANTGMKACPGALTGNTIIKIKNLKGEFIAAKRKFSFTGAEEFTFGGKASGVQGEYVLESLKKPIEVGKVAGQPQWQTAEEFLDANEAASMINEAGKAELIDKSLGLTISCGHASANGFVERRSEGPGVGAEDISFTECKVVSPSGCKVAETIALKAKSKLVTLGAESYGEELTAMTEGGGIAKIEITSCSCPKMGTYELSGDTVGKVNNESAAVEFTSPAQSGSSLELGGTPVLFISTIDLKGGGELEVGE